MLIMEKLKGIITEIQKMYRFLRKIIKQLIRNFVGVASKSRLGNYFCEQVLNASMNFKRDVCYRGVSLSFIVPNGLNRFRVDSFSTKEPETLEWIDGIPEGSVFWDVGANVGLYSCYAARSRGCQVFAFEPSVFNLELLSRNIFINGLVNNIVIVPLPLTDHLALSTLNMTSTDWGGAFSTFGQDYTHDGNKIKKSFEFSTLGISMTEAVELLKIPEPDFIKMDVDGIEHLILKGGNAALKKVKGVIIEINEVFDRQSIDSAKYLEASGLVFKEKKHAGELIGTRCYNQVWYRP